MLGSIWTKIVAWFSKEAKAVEVAFDRDEQIVLGALKPILAAAETAVTADLVVTTRAILAAVRANPPKDLAGWEALVLNALEALGGELFDLAKNLGSNVLQALIGLLLAELPAVVQP